ncbi:interleukin-1 receptor accessory protein-like 1 [Clavelina lepadiformis]|uniref:interleukin-1 receptor accessory protein-like 1 n=1 Tax=Clavelina lepadiformis TaxID=159417 RepID=UPI0040414CEE
MPTPMLDLGDIQKNETYEFQMKFIIPSSDKCYGFHVTVVPTLFQEVSCEVFTRKSLPEIKTYPGNQIGTSDEMFCELGNFDVPKIFTTEVEAKWSRNCSSLPANTILKKKNTLFLSEIEYEHAGIYTCSITYNGMTRFIAAFAVCVLEPPTTSPPTLQCENKIHANVGETVSIPCQLRLGIGEFDYFSFKAVWKKVITEESSNVTGTCTQSPPVKSDFRISCFSEHERKCFLYVPDTSERIRNEEVINLNLQIQKLLTSDFGTYNFLAKINRNSTPVYAQAEVEENHLPKLFQTAEIAKRVCSAIVPALAVLVLSVFLFYYKQVHFRVYIKRHLRSCEFDDKRYGACISYHCTRGLDIFAHQYVSESVRVTCEKLQRLGYKIYDEHKDFIHGMRAHNLLESIDICHRVVIVLTSNYLKDDWSMRNLQQAFQTMIASKTKIIFILIPGIKEYLKQHAKTNDACLLIRTALKINYTIQWTNDKSFDDKFFQLQLEDAMPKLKSQNVRRGFPILYNQPEENLAGTGFQRRCSTITNITVL